MTILLQKPNAIYGGLFKYDTYTDDGTEYKLSDYVASGYAVAPNDDPNTQTEYPWTVKESELEGVAKIGSNWYPDLDTALMF